MQKTQFFFIYKIMAFIEHVDLTKRVYEELKKMILEGELKPGEKILQEKIAKQLGISRTPLLKALQMLEYELLVECIPRRGMYVKKLTTREIIDVFYAREVLEGLAARLSAQKISDDQIAQLRGLFEPFLQNTNNISFEAYEKADRRFHIMILKISDSTVLNRLEMIGNVLLIAYQASLVRPPSETLSEHIAIIDAISTRNGDLAERLCRDHISKSRAKLAKEIEIQQSKE
ncbi:GntR family transcriptional regulator [candidate division KSB1 bacterium]|nr:GntR family transcriptional regulator [candidate division KSB1 bacterium]